MDVKRSTRAAANPLVSRMKPSNTSANRNRPFGLSARLPVHLRTRCRDSRRQSHRPRAGAKDNSYTAGVICAKVARYAERIHHPDRLLKPLVRAGAKGEGNWKEASWETALDLVAERFVKAEASLGSETVWPYYYAGTMGSCSATASTGCAMPRNIPAISNRSAPTSPGQAT